MADDLKLCAHAIVKHLVKSLKRFPPVRLFRHKDFFGGKSQTCTVKAIRFYHFSAFEKMGGRRGWASCNLLGLIGGVCLRWYPRGDTILASSINSGMHGE